MTQTINENFYSILWLVYSCGESQVCIMCGFGFYEVNFAERKSLSVCIAGEETLGRIAVTRGHAGFMFFHLEKSVCLCASVLGVKESKCSKGRFIVIILSVSLCYEKLSEF